MWSLRIYVEVSHLMYVLRITKCSQVFILLECLQNKKKKNFEKLMVSLNLFCCCYFFKNVSNSAVGEVIVCSL